MKQIRIEIDDDLHGRARIAAIQLKMTLAEFLKAALLKAVLEAEKLAPPKDT